MQTLRRALSSALFGTTLGALALTGCGKKADEADKPAAETAKAAATAPGEAAGTAPAEKPEPKPIELPPGDGPVAKVNGEDIAREMFNREFRQTLERYQRARHDVQPALRERLKDNIVRRLVDQALIRQQATKMKVTIPEDEMGTKWTEHKKRYGSDEAFKSFLERAGTTADDVRRQFESNLMREKVFAKVSESVTVDGKEVRKFYDDNQARYDEPEQVKASHILLRVPPNAKPEEKAAKKKKAEEILATARSGKKSFEDLAKEFGEDPTKARGGDLGYFTKGRMVKPFEEAAWKLKKGQVSDVVETQFGFHIIKKTDYKKAAKRPFKDVKAQIERSLTARKRNEAIRTALSKWKEEAELEIFVKGDPAIIAAGAPKPRLGGRPQIQPARPNAKGLSGAGLKLNKSPMVPNTSGEPAKK